MNFIETDNGIYEVLDSFHNGFEMVYKCKTKPYKEGYHIEIKEHQIIHYINNVKVDC